MSKLFLSKKEKRKQRKVKARKIHYFKRSTKKFRDKKRIEILAKIKQSNLNNENDQFNNCKLFYGNFIEQSQKEIQDNSIDFRIIIFSLK